MPDGYDSDPVTFGRWQEAHSRLQDRINELEEDVDAIRRIQHERRDKQWALIMVFLTGLALPLVVAAAVAFFSSQTH